SVALSMVTLAPIDQFGCLRACSGVAASSASRVHVRNGPPEAVRTIFSTDFGSAPESAWNAAECSLSTGRSSAPERAISAVNTLPAETRHSLLASAMRAPQDAAANVGR